MSDFEVSLIDIVGGALHQIEREKTPIVRFSGLSRRQLVHWFFNSIVRIKSIEIEIYEPFEDCAEYLVHCRSGSESFFLAIYETYERSHNLDTADVRITIANIENAKKYLSEMCRLIDGLLVDMNSVRDFYCLRSETCGKEKNA